MAMDTKFTDRFMNLKLTPIDDEHCAEYMMGHRYEMELQIMVTKLGADPLIALNNCKEEINRQIDDFITQTQNMGKDKNV